MTAPGESPSPRPEGALVEAVAYLIADDVVRKLCDKPCSDCDAWRNQARAALQVAGRAAVAVARETAKRQACHGCHNSLPIVAKEMATQPWQVGMHRGPNGQYYEDCYAVDDAVAAALARVFGVEE